MSDKPLVQQELAQELANLVLMIAGIKVDATGERLERVPSKVDDTARALAALDFFQGFWTTMQSEWLGVDKFRYVVPSHVAESTNTICSCGDFCMLG